MVGGALAHGLRAKMLPQVVMRRRIHRHNLTRRRETLQDYPRLLHAVLQRKRRGQA